MHEHLHLPPHPGSIARGRHWATQLARRARASRSTERTLELLTSELVTNALVHTRPREPITISAEVRDDVLRVAVSDPDPTMPVVRPVSPEQPGGNGMRIVATLATRWGVDVHPGGKTVWFEAPVTEPEKLLSA